MAKSALVALGGPPNGTKRRIYDARCGRAASVPEHMGCALNDNLATLPARSIILAKPAIVNGAPRSDVNTKGDLGSCSAPEPT
jgi:hypothetical protein